MQKGLSETIKLVHVVHAAMTGNRSAAEGGSRLEGAARRAARP